MSLEDERIGLSDLRAWLDPTHSPSQDFYRYAVGGYLKGHPIPADQASWGVLEALGESNSQVLRGLLDGLPGRAPAGSLDHTLGTFYRNGMNQEAIEQAGLEPLRPLLLRIESIESRRDLESAIAWLHVEGFAVVFSLSSEADAGDPSMAMGEIWQGGLGLPEREYYLDADKDEIRTAYRLHVGRMLSLAGYPASWVDSIMELETRLAEASLDLLELRDPHATYHPMDVRELHSMAPKFDWARYLQAMGLSRLAKINVATPDFCRIIDDLLERGRDWKPYLLWHVLDSTAPYLSNAFEAENFDFHERVMSGTPQQLPRWRRIVSDTDGLLGDALGQLYVQRQFSASSRDAAVALAESIRSAAREAIADCSWMGDRTRAAARLKLDAMVLKVGYPDRWLSYDGLRLEEGPYIESVLRCWRFEMQRELNKMGRPVDRSEWDMTVSSVNAYYDDTANEFVLPAGLLQPPLFGETADPAANYGATAATVAHELTHAFDDEGCEYDWEGRLADWWTEDDYDRFEAIGDGVARQMSGYRFEDRALNGELVQGEATADLGGLELAWRAFSKLRLADVPDESGFTPSQRFFLHYALSWAASQRPEEIELQLATDEHPLPEFRVNAPLANMPAFWQAFDIPTGSPMRRDADRNHLWD